MEYMDVCGRMLKACRRLEDLGLIYGTWGNISVRCGEGFIVTPSRIEYDVMTAEDMVYMDFGGKILRGSRVPTSERDIHRLILQNRSDLGAVVHTHSPYSCAAAAAGLTLEALIEEIAQLIGGPVRCTPAYVPAQDHLRLAECTVETLGSANAVLIRNHGPMAAGASLAEALVCAQVVEKAAQMQLTLMGGAAYTPIAPQYVAAERKRFLEKYGKE
jgi:L-ribulose-5-phosphate 4-epimerase